MASSAAGVDAAASGSTAATAASAGPASTPRSWADRIDPGAGDSQGGAEPPSKETLGW
jgi:hypothetical protein